MLWFSLCLLIKIINLADKNSLAGSFTFKFVYIAPVLERTILLGIYLVSDFGNDSILSES